MCSYCDLHNLTEFHQNFCQLCQQARIQIGLWLIPEKGRTFTQLAIHHQVGQHPKLSQALSNKLRLKLSGTVFGQEVKSIFLFYNGKFNDIFKIINEVGRIPRTFAAQRRRIECFAQCQVGAIKSQLSFFQGTLKPFKNRKNFLWRDKKCRGRQLFILERACQ